MTRASNIEPVQCPAAFAELSDKAPLAACAGTAYGGIGLTVTHLRATGEHDVESTTVERGGFFEPFAWA
jgi:hypothetical protein